MFFSFRINRLFPIIFCLPSCTHGVFSIPPASFTYYENLSGTGRAVTIMNDGITLDTNADSGVVIGRMNKTYFLEGKNSRKSMENNFDFNLDSDNRKKSNNINRYRLMEKKESLSDWQIDTAVAYGVVAEGITLSANMYRGGFTVGLSHYARLFLPAEFDGVVFINTKLNVINQSIFSIESAK